MIKMYVMETCPDCEYFEKQVVDNPRFEVIDIGKHVRNLKQFLKTQKRLTLEGNIVISDIENRIKM